jgi:hypothetical protein
MSTSLSAESTKKKPLFIALMVFGVMFLAADAAIGIYLLKPKPPIPKNIQSQLDFTPYLVQPGTGITIDTSSYKYDASQKGLSFIARGKEYGKLTISEQPTPQQFIDIPEVYSKLVDKLNRYGVFDNAIGTVYLTRPDGQHTGQTAVINSKGVLMFVRSAKDLSDDQWRKVFGSFVLEKT